MEHLRVHHDADEQASPQVVSLATEEREVILNRIKSEVQNAQQQNEAAFESLNRRLHALESAPAPRAARGVDFVAARPPPPPPPPPQVSHGDVNVVGAATQDG
jgi:hypothetical protein